MTLSSYAWAFLGTSVAEVSGCVTAIMVAHIKTSRRQEETKAKLAKVEELAKPTGNGFANSVLCTLQRIEAAQGRTEQKIDEHIASHANRDLRGRGR